MDVFFLRFWGFDFRCVVNICRKYTKIYVLVCLFLDTTNDSQYVHGDDLPTTRGDTFKEKLTKEAAKTRIIFIFIVFKNMF